MTMISYWRCANGHERARPFSRSGCPTCGASEPEPTDELPTPMGGVLNVDEVPLTIDTTGAPSIIEVPTPGGNSEAD